ncbi:outer membrane beta-barrel family protein [Desertivirga xinjiangensis]|uniref:outer membrane beta-barrel family protein n=1 Tax=Desertivirga xinjiangensis TaxID=539206 RepID=UPI002109E99E|nr:outer membrane beta-barrel family protein [Pedobacter xinjiangensis]
MAFKALSVVLLLLLSITSSAQDKFTIKGVARDSAAFLKLPNTSISVLNAKDSTLIDFTRAAADGNFSINNLPTGKLILLMTYPGYADYVEHFTLDSIHITKDCGNIDMQLTARLLAEVVIKGKADAITIKGDTTEFNASAYVIQPNARVEDLIKQFPGIQVDKDGKITAQGQTVTKVLVDGEEFFGDDPTLVTKNLRADMVDKVQLYDKKSDQATFTGIDDGVKDKTLNIKLKEDKKKGYFGKVDAGASDDYNSSQAMFNAFTAKQKISLYGINSNTGKTGLNWEDRNRYGASNTEVNSDGDIVFYGNRDDINYNGEGIPEAQTGAVHYETKWNENKESINLNYKVGAIDINGIRNNLSQNNLPTGVLNTNSDQDFRNYLSRQKLDAIYKVKLDSTSDLKLTIEGTIRNTESNNNYNTVSRNGEQKLQNTSTRLLTNEGDQQNFYANVFWTKKLKKKRRTLSVNATGSYNKNDSEGYLNSVNQFYNPVSSPDGSPLIDSEVKIDQLKLNNSTGKVFNSNITYTEPLSKLLALTFNYSLGLNKGSSDMRSYNQTAPGVYNDFDEVFSNNFELNQLSHQTGAIFNYKKDKTTVNFGSKVSYVNFDQVDLYNSNSYKREFINFSPQVNYQYKFSQQKALRIDYNGNNNQPGINQIQPVRVNTDPLNIYLGNPGLKPSFNNRFNANYNTFKILSNQYFYASGSFQFTTNAIVDSRFTDSFGKSTYQSVNIKGKLPSNFNLYGGFSRKFPALGDLNLGFNFNGYGNTYFNYINDELNRTKSNNYSLNLSVNKYKAKKYEMWFSFGPSYNTSESSLQKQLNNNGWNFNGQGNVGLYLPGKFEFSLNGEYRFQEKTISFNEDFERFIVNSSIKKKFLKTDNLALSLSGNDLLNQNNGFSRNAYGNTITQNTYTTIKRYFLLSLIWDFNKMGGGIKTPATPR